MKKVLLGTTAILGAAVLFAAPAAAEMETVFSGFLRAEFWGVDQDEDDPRDYVFGVDDSEFHIKARNTADNGLTYGVNLEFELADTVGMDEGYLYFSGDNWGTIQLGGNEGANSSMPYSGDFSLTGSGGYDGGMSNIYNHSSTIYFPDLIADTGDSAKINYFSPRFSGFQIGLSYQPDSGQATVGSDTNNADSSVAAVTALAPNTTVVISAAGSDDDDEDVFSIGANWVDSINGVDIGIGGAYLTSSTESGSTAGREDSEGAHVGFHLGFSGFTFGMSYADNFDTGCTVSGCDGGQFYEVAGGYSAGPFALGLGWFHGEKDIDSTTDEETDIITIGGSYALAPGASIYSEIDFVDEDDNDGTVFMVGTAISF